MCQPYLVDVLRDDIDEATKKRRLQEVIDTFHAVAAQKNAEEIGKTHLVLVEGVLAIDSVVLTVWPDKQEICHST